MRKGRVVLVCVAPVVARRLLVERMRWGAHASTMVRIAGSGTVALEQSAHASAVVIDTSAGGDPVGLAKRVRLRTADAALVLVDAPRNGAAVLAAVARALAADRGGAAPDGTGGAAGPVVPVPGRAGGTDGAAAEPYRLTGREMDVLAGIMAGRKNKEIAADLHTTESTVRTHVRRLLHKLGARDRAHAVALALRAGVVQGRG